jgi:hypothetical protein
VATKLTQSPWFLKTPKVLHPPFLHSSFRVGRQRGSPNASAPRLLPNWVALAVPTKAVAPVTGSMVTSRPPSARPSPVAVPPYSVPSQANWRLTTPPDGDAPGDAGIGATNVARPVAGSIR